MYLVRAVSDQVVPRVWTRSEGFFLVLVPWPAMKSGAHGHARMIPHDLFSIYTKLHQVISATLLLHYITLHTLHYSTLHYITLHYITLHYITLHYITLHYITLSLVYGQKSHASWDPVLARRTWLPSTVFRLDALQRFLVCCLYSHALALPCACNITAYQHCMIPLHA